MIYYFKINYVTYNIFGVPVVQYFPLTKENVQYINSITGYTCNYFQHLINNSKEDQNKVQENTCKSIELSRPNFEDTEYVCK